MISTSANNVPVSSGVSATACIQTVVSCRNIPLTLSLLLVLRLLRNVVDVAINALECRGTYSATASNMKLVHWPLMGGLLHLVQRGGE